MNALLTADPLVDERPFSTSFSDPVRIRLAIHARGNACMLPDAHYLVVIGLFKLLGSFLFFRFVIASRKMVWSFTSPCGKAAV